MSDITVIGGINIDIEGRPYKALKREDSNPGRIMLSYGGVGRNIAENAARMGADVAMISVIGDDHIGKGARDHLALLGADVSGVDVIPGETSATYLSILNDINDMEVAVNDMSIVDHILPEYIDKKADIISSSRIIAMDGNLCRRTIEYVTERFSHIPMFFDPVSTLKAVRASDIIGRFTCIKPNVMEAETLSGVKIESEDGLRRAADRFIEMGVEKIFITLNKNGVYYKDRCEEGFIRPKDVVIKSATGAGDSFSAAILVNMVRRENIRDIARYGMAAAAVTMESPHAVNEKICKEEIERRIADV